MRSAVSLLLVACAGPDGVDRRPFDRGSEPAAVLAPATLRKLTTEQYAATLGDLLGEGLVLPTSLEPDLEVQGLFAVGAGQAAISPLGVEQYESASYLVAGQVMADPARRASIVPCEPAGTVDDECAAAFVRDFGRLAWRRSLQADEIDALVSVAASAAATLDDFWGGLEYALAALLQSPNFLYRVEVGEGGAFDDLELASRMSYFLWNGPPDAELLDLAEEGRLADAEVRRDQASRMLDDPRAVRGVRTFFDEMLGLWQLPSLAKDPTVFVHWSDTLGSSAREETLRVIEDLVFADADFRDLLVSRRTFIDRELAAVYGVQAPAREGFAATELPADGPRAGLLGMTSFLALEAHPVSTSVTRRGKFIREKLLCQSIPAPPADVDTSIPEPSGDLPTMRDRVAVHLEDPNCAICHRITDPLGLALEHFDGVGLYRETEDGYPIDASGDLDGVEFDTALGLSESIRMDASFPQCMAETALRYAQGHPLSDEEEELSEWFALGFGIEGFPWRSLLADVVASDAFTRAEVGP